jgi:hypothetical protein
MTKTSVGAAAVLSRTWETIRSVFPYRTVRCILIDNRRPLVRAIKSLLNTYYTQQCIAVVVVVTVMVVVAAG